MSQLDQLWAACKALEGTPYVFGGKDIARDGGLDCSGFVCQVFADVGVNLGDPDYTSAQRLWDNAQDTGDDVRPGDIICFTQTYAPADPVTHIGIIRYPQPIARMWNANDAEGVALSSYSSAYWQQHYYGHRRIPGLEVPTIDSPWTAAEIAAATGCPADAVAKNWPRIVQEIEAVGQGSKASLAAVCATVAIETATTFEPVREAFWLTEEWRAQNLRYYPYFGRGYVQLTWEDAYRAYGERLGLDLVNQPDLALEPDTAAKILALYWADRDIAAMADRGDWEAVRKAVQGGDAGLDRLISIITALLG